MRPRKSQYEKDTVSTFKLKKVMTISELSKTLRCSFSTVRRRLKEWEALTSYNKNGCYYTLPGIPKFTKRGLWKHRDIFFSKHGTLKKTIVHFVRTSRKGLSNYELEEILGINPNAYIPQFGELVGFKKERYKKEVIHFSSEEEIYKSQKEKRFPSESSAPKLPPDAMTIIILVELIQNPRMSIEELSSRLHDKGYKIEVNTIVNLFKHYNISKKKLSMK